MSYLSLHLACYNLSIYMAIKLTNIFYLLFQNFDPFWFLFYNRFSDLLFHLFLAILTEYPQEEMVIHEKIKRGAIAPSLIFSWITIFSCGYFDYYTLLKFWANSRFRSMMQSILKKRLISLKNVITVDPLKYGIGNVFIS